MNRKGYTLVEILAVVAILGILMGGATIAISTYIKNSRDKSYDAMRENICAGVKDVIIDAPTASDFEEAGILPTIARNITTSFSKIRNGEDYTYTYLATYLINAGYINKLTSPIHKDKNCNNSLFKIESIPSEDNNSMNTYKCYVRLRCEDRYVDNEFKEVNVD